MKPSIKFLLTIFFLIGLLSLPSTPTHAESGADQSACEQLTAIFLRPYIAGQINAYYASKFTTLPTYAYYYGTEISIDHVQQNNDYFVVHVRMFPYLGPHIAVGEDEIIFRISPLGEVKTLNFTHLKDYKLPEYLEYYYK